MEKKMSSLMKIVAVVILGLVAISLVQYLVGALMKLVLPLLIIGTVVYIVVKIASPNSLGGGRNIMR